MILVTGGAGFIGSHFIKSWNGPVQCFDKLTYAGDAKRLPHGVQRFWADICSRKDVEKRFFDFPKALFHFAAETHVTTSIFTPDVFVQTNVNGTLTLLEESLRYWKCRPDFKFVHISTDEVFGSLGPSDAPFTESSPYRPSTPYAASKAASDHLVKVFHHTYGLPVLIINSSNNYGPQQHPEKLIPLTIKNALEGKSITVHGDGKGTRDWLHVEDFCGAIKTIYEHGTIGESYVVGGRNERSALEVIDSICKTLDELKPKKGSYIDKIIHIPDRPGNDRRYAVNPSKVESLGWRPRRNFALREVVESYL